MLLLILRCFREERHDTTPRRCRCDIAAITLPYADAMVDYAYAWLMFDVCCLRY